MSKYQLSVGSTEGFQEGAAGDEIEMVSGHVADEKHGDGHGLVGGGIHNDHGHSPVDGRAHEALRLLVKNYQSIKSAEVKVDGFTAVTGKTNLGKSALIRAATAAMFGQLGESFVREGESQTAVGLWFSDGTEIKWYKVPTEKKAPGKQTRLIVNGEQFTKLGRDHFQLTEPLGFKILTTAAGGIRPQIAQQFDNPFLVAENESVIAEAFKVLGRGDVVARARESVKKDWAKTKLEMEVRLKDLEKVEEEAGKFSWLGEMKQRVEDLRVKAEEEVKERNKKERAVQMVQKRKTWKEVEVPGSVNMKPVPFAVLGRIQAWRELRITPIPSMEKELPDMVMLGRVQKIRSERGEEEKLQQRVGEIVTRRDLEVESLRVLEEEMKTCPLCGRGFGEVHAH